jgi:stage II sporulation protein D
VALIALAGKVVSPRVSATAAWQVDEQGGQALLVRGGGNEPWRIEQRGALLRIVGEGNDATPWREGPFIARPNGDNAFVMYDNKRYRGELWFTPTDSGVLVVNRLPVEEYLRGVVPLELGTRNEIDRAALEAQSIAARSYSYARVPSGELVVPARGWHMVATVSNQVYGGVNAEHPVVDAAIRATAGLVLRYDGVLVDAPYYSSCGGRTATPREAWRDASQEPYLQSVSDVNPSTGRPWCEISPRNQWTAEFDEHQLEEVARRALVAAGQSARSATVREITVGEQTPSGRVGSLIVDTDGGRVTLRLGEIRNVFRDARGAILSSTYFSVDRVTRGRGHLTGVALRGAGNGHGVGMCQWGAIGRARAGQDSRTILRHYYPGTVVGFAD